MQNVCYVCLQYLNIAIYSIVLYSIIYKIQYNIQYVKSYYKI